MERVKGASECEGVAMDSLLQCGVLWSLVLEQDDQRLLRYLEKLQDLAQEHVSPWSEEIPAVSVSTEQFIRVAEVFVPPLPVT